MGVTEPTTPPVDPGARWQAVADELKAYRGQWRRVVRRATSDDAAKELQKAISKGRYVAFRPAGHYQGAKEGLQVKAVYWGPAGRPG